MKSLIFTLALIFSFVSYSQKLEIDPNRGVYTMAGIINLDGVSKQQIFDEAYRFMALTFSDIENLIIQSNGDVFSIYARVKLHVHWYGDGVRYKMFIEIKDGKLRYTLTNFTFGLVNFEQKNFIGKEETIKKTEFELGNLLFRLESSCRNPEKW
jgi:hypothetical protein